MIENYQKYYYALFNQITDLISELETKNFTQQMMIDSLKKLQIDAEERFLKRADRQTMEYENSIYQQYLILNNGLMSIFVEDSEKYQKTPESAELLSELHHIMDEANQLNDAYMESHKNEFKILHVR